MKDYRTEDEKKDDIYMIEHAVNWPQVVLPVKRYEDDGEIPECAVLLQGKPPIVKIWNLWDDPKKLRGAKELTYESAAEMVNAGWIVD